MKTSRSVRSTAIGLVTALASATIALAAAPSASAATDIKVGVLPLNTTGALQYAIDTGIFAKNGLNVTTQTFPSSPAALAGLAGGAVQFTYSVTIPVINAYANAGMALKIVAPNEGYTTQMLARARKEPAFASRLDLDAVCVKASSAIQSWKDLAGKVVSLPVRRAQAEVVVANAMKKEGANPASVSWVSLGFPEAVPAVMQGKVDAGFVVAPFTGQCTSSGGRLLGAPGMKFWTDERTTGVWVTTAAYAAQNPDVVLAFQKSIKEANAWASANFANRRKAVELSTKISKQTPQVAAIPEPIYYSQRVTKTDIQSAANKLLALGFLTKPVDVAGLLMKQY